MPYVTSLHHNWFFQDRCHIDENDSNGARPQEIQITLLQLQVVDSLTREEMNGNVRELRENLCREMDALNREVEDVRARQLDVSHMTDDLRNHFFPTAAFACKGNG
ncbi:unnamed protein product [Lactuca virosa]|uniref:Uncharacterized protein n=1 Tax=Lactuca virosa TaxID=75947 RepID=A0AAU9NNE5_9ASTR|nr:unnamed protein product [Lactuca virosa]